MFIKEPIKTLNCHQFVVLFVRFLSVSRKLLNVKIIDDEEYEKNKTFTIVLEEPVLLEVGQRHGESSVMSFSVFNDGRESKFSSMQRIMEGQKEAFWSHVTRLPSCVSFMFF